MIRFLAWLTLLVVALAASARGQQMIPEKCVLEGTAVYLENIQKLCPNLLLTFKGHDLMARVAKSGDAACLSFSRQKIADDIKAMPSHWCAIAAKVTRADEKVFVERRE